MVNSEKPDPTNNVRELHYLYKITNTLNNKVYIGQTIRPKKRWVEHQYASKKNTKKYYIHQALSKYGINNFIYEVIDYGLDQWQSDALEASYIKQYDSLNKEKGYNLTTGGEVHSLSKETRAKISAAQIGKKLSEETKKKMSGKVPWNKGKKSNTGSNKKSIFITSG